MKDLEIVKSNLANFLEILKAKRREEGETWTQPSGRKVTKKNGKIVPVKGEAKPKKEPTKKEEESKKKDTQNKYKEIEDKYIEDHLRSGLEMKGFSKESVSKMNRKQLESEGRKYYGNQVDKLLKNAHKNIHKHPKYKKLTKKNNSPEIIPFNPKEGVTYKFENGKIIPIIKKK